jgi:type VI secretion system protein ImpG
MQTPHIPRIPSVPGTRLKNFFEAEMSALRGEAADFAARYPEIAHSLGLGAHHGHAGDPQVELLLQSFAFLTGRLRHQVEQDKAALPNSLLGLLYPHLEAPIPSMLVAEIEVKPDGADFAKEQILERGRYVKAVLNDERGRKVDCRFRTCYETPLVPLHVKDIQPLPALNYAFLGGLPKVQSAIQVRLRLDRPMTGEGPKRLRFHIDSAAPHAWDLYEALALNLAGVAVYVAQDGETSQFDAEPLYHRYGRHALRWLGMHDEESALEPDRNAHPGYRLLQEYFSFPDKFMFFDVEGLDFRLAGDTFDLLLLLDMPMPKGMRFSSRLLRLNCVPLVNLFAQRIDPLALDHTHYEYRLVGDVGNHQTCELHTLKELESVRPDGSMRPIVPHFSVDQFERLAHHDYFYVTRRERSLAAGVAGSELYVSFLDKRFDLTQLPDEVVTGKALCTNRRLPEKLTAGHPMQLEGPGPVTVLKVLSRPTPHQTPAEVGSRPWLLVSQLTLNHLSLSDEDGSALKALKEILLLHAGPDKRRALRQVDGIRNLQCRPMVRQVGADGWRGFARGLQITLEMDRHDFQNASPVLFCSVLRRFLAQYATVNTPVEVHLRTHDLDQSNPINDSKASWPPLSGARPVL